MAKNNRRRTYKVEMQALGAKDFQKAFTEINKTLVSVQNNSKKISETFTKELKASTKKSVDAIGKLEVQLKDLNTTAQINAILVDELSKANQGYREQIKSLTKQMQALSTRVDKNSESLKKNSKRVKENSGALGVNSGAVRGGTRAVDNLRAAHERGYGAWARTTKAAERNAVAGGSAARAMSDMALSSGPLVRAYALLAANFFAIQQATTLILEGEQLTKLEQNLSNIGKTSEPITALAVSMQALTAGALSYQEALKQSARVTAYSFSAPELEKMTIAARKASIALGINLSDAMDRIVRGVQKQEVEVLDEIGVVTRLEVAFKKFADQNGKTVKSLTDSERKTALLNEVLFQTESQFGNVSLQAGTFEKSLSNIQTIVGSLTQSLAGLVDIAGTAGTASLAGVFAIGATGFAGSKAIATNAAALANNAALNRRNASTATTRGFVSDGAGGSKLAPAPSSAWVAPPQMDAGDRKKAQGLNRVKNATKSLGGLGNVLTRIVGIVMASPWVAAITAAAAAFLMFSDNIAEYIENNKLHDALNRDMETMERLGNTADKTASQIIKLLTQPASLAAQSDGLLARGLFGKDGVTTLKTMEAGRGFLEDNVELMRRLGKEAAQRKDNVATSLAMTSGGSAGPKKLASQDELQEQLDLFNKLNGTELELDETTRNLVKAHEAHEAQLEMVKKLGFESQEVLDSFNASLRSGGEAASNYGKGLSAMIQGLQVKTGMESMVEQAKNLRTEMNNAFSEKGEGVEAQKAYVSLLEKAAKEMKTTADRAAILAQIDLAESLHMLKGDAGSFEVINERKISRLSMDPTNARNTKDREFKYQKSELATKKKILEGETKLGKLTKEQTQFREKQLELEEQQIATAEHLEYLRRKEYDTLTNIKIAHASSKHILQSTLPLIGSQLPIAAAITTNKKAQIEFDNKSNILLAQKDTLVKEEYTRRSALLAIEGQILALQKEKNLAQAEFNELLKEQQTRQELDSAKQGNIDAQALLDNRVASRERQGFAATQGIFAGTDAMHSLWAKEDANEAQRKLLLDKQADNLAAMEKFKAANKHLTEEQLANTTEMQGFSKTGNMLAEGLKGNTIAQEGLQEDKMAVAFGRVNAEMDNIAALDPAGGSLINGMRDLHEVMKNMGEINFASVFTEGAAGMDVLAGGLKAGASIMSAFSQSAVQDIDHQIAMEKKRDGKSAESQKKIAALEKKKMKEMQKAKLQQAVMATAAGIAESLSLPFPMNFIQAGIVGAMGALQISQIKKKGAQDLQLANTAGASDPMKLSLGKLDRQVDTSKQATGLELDLLRGTKGGRATGGEIMPGHGYVVGENGPEVVTPDIPMTVHSNSDSMEGGFGGGITISPNISAFDAKSFGDRLPEVSRQIVDSVEMELNNRGMSLNTLRR